MNEHRRCKQTLDKLQPFLDRELSECEVGVVRFHLDKCPPCQHMFRFEEHLRRLVRVRACTETAPAELRAQILAKVRVRRQRLAVGDRPWHGGTADR